jgi:hypothetical protein
MFPYSGKASTCLKERRNTKREIEKGMVHYRCGEVTSKNSEKVSSLLYFYYDTGHRGNDKTDSTIIVCRNQEAGGFCSRLQRWEEAGSRRKQEGPVRDQEAAAEVVIGGRRGRM